MTLLLPATQDIDATIVEELAFIGGDCFGQVRRRRTPIPSGASSDERRGASEGHC